MTLQGVQFCPYMTEIKEAVCGHSLGFLLAILHVVQRGGGDVAFRRVVIDRDVFYYNGLEKKTPNESFAAVEPRGDVHINKESFFPMGDHCPSSYDARSWGSVPLANLKGPALYIWWPPDRIRKIPTP